MNEPAVAVNSYRRGVTSSRQHLALLRLWEMNKRVQ